MQHTVTQSPAGNAAEPAREAAPVASRVQPHLLEPAVSLSRSVLWKIQRNYYEQMGVDAWRKGLIPHYITSNTWVAQLYAQLVMGYLRDVAANQPASQRVHIVELGAGSGRFSFHFLKKFFALHAQSSLGHIPVRFVMTDLVDRNIEFWRNHPGFAPFVENGQLDFARFDVENPAPLRLLASGDAIAPGDVRRPMIVFANYIFDTVVCDLFSVDGGKIFEERVVVRGPQPEPDFKGAVLIKQLSIEYERHPVEAAHYNDPALDAVLAEYEREFSNTLLTVPIGAVRCLRYLAGIAGGQLFALVADRGHNNQEAMIDDPGPAMALHDGCFSLTVNFHALGRCVELMDGLALHPSTGPIDLNLSAFILGLHAPAARETLMAFKQTAALRGPETFLMLKSSLDKTFEHFSLDQILAILRVCEWDASPFMSALPRIVAQLPSASAVTRRELQWTIHNVWSNYYPLGEENDLAFNMAGLLYEMGCYPEAAVYLQHSLRIYGPDPGTVYNLARCAFRLRQFPEALELTNHALEMDPNLSAAKVMRTRLLGELRHHSS